MQILGHVDYTLTKYKNAVLFFWARIDENFRLVIHTDVPTAFGFAGPNKVVATKVDIPNFQLDVRQYCMYTTTVSRR